MASFIYKKVNIAECWGFIDWAAENEIAWASTGECDSESMVDFGLEKWPNLVRPVLVL